MGAISALCPQPVLSARHTPSLPVMHLTSPCAGVALVHPPLPQPPTKSTGHDDRHLSFSAGQFHGLNPDPHARCCRDARPGSIERQRQCTRLANRERVVEGKGGSVQLISGGRRNIKK